MCTDYGEEIKKNKKIEIKKSGITRLKVFLIVFDFQTIRKA